MVSVAQREQLASALKEQSHLSRSPGREAGESQNELKLHLDEREGDQSGRMERKEWTPL